MTAGPGVTKHASKEKRSDGKFRILSLESKYLETWNKSCANVNEPKQGKDQNIHLRAAGVVQACHKFLISDKIKPSLSVKATNCLFFTTLDKETRGTFVPLHVTLLLQNLQCLEGWNSVFEDMQWKAIEHMRAKTSDRKHAVRSCCHSRIALSPRARNRRTFPANWQDDIFTFRHLIKPRVGGRGSLKKFLQALSLPSSP